MDTVTLQLIGQLMLAAVAGLLLNLTPCVLPAIPVKIRTTVYQVGGSPRQRTLAALAFTGGTLLFFLPLAIATTALHWTWGTLFQSSIVLWILIAALLLFAYTTYAIWAFQCRSSPTASAANAISSHSCRACSVRCWPPPASARFWVE